MDILLIGSRGREHALAMALEKDSRVGKIFCLPGNGGLEKTAECIQGSVTDFASIEKILEENKEIGLTVIGPDETLAAGLADYLTERGHRVFGPCAQGAKMESDKSFCHKLCSDFNIPAPSYSVFSDYEKAKEYAAKQNYPLVVKTNGRTAGKGIFISKSYIEASNTLYDIMIAEMFGSAGKTVDIEEFLEGQNVVVMTVTDGENVIQFPAVRAYKRAYDRDMGMNTAGMGAYLPAEEYTKETAERAMNEIFKPTVAALKSMGIIYKGVLAYSLILTKDGPKAVDFIVRFCDVEGQVVLPMLKTPILDIMNAAIDGKIDEIKLEFNEGAAVCVVLTSGGYPLDYNKNVKINIGELDDTVTVFHAGTKLSDGDLRTSGGRVMGVFSSGASKNECVKNVYRNIARINFDGMHYRKDIARAKD